MAACCMIRAFCRPLQKLAECRGGFRVGLPYRHHHGIFIIDQRVRIIASRENQAQPLVRHVRPRHTRSRLYPQLLMRRLRCACVWTT